MEALVEEIILILSEVNKEEVLNEIIKIICRRFLNQEKEENKKIDTEINEILDKYKFINDEFVEIDKNTITPEIFTILHFRINYFNNKNNKGVFYTNIEFCKEFTKDIWDEFIARKCNLSKEKLKNKVNLELYKNIILEIIKCCKILDLGCGTGNLLISMIKNIYDIINDLELNITLKEIIENFSAIDIDSKALYILKIRLALFMYSKGDKLTIKEVLSNNENELFKNILKKDLTKKEDNSSISNKYDIIISNPPYDKVEIKDIYIGYKEQYSIKSMNNYDIYFLFMNKTFDLIKKYGIIGLITSNKYLQNESALDLRKRIYEDFTILWIKEKFEKIFNENVQANIIITALENKENKILLNDNLLNNLNSNKYFNNNSILDMDNKYNIYIISNQILEIKNKLRICNKKVGDYFEVHRGKKNNNEKIKNRDIYRYNVKDRKYNHLKDDAIIIIPEECQENRFAMIDKSYRENILESTIYMDFINESFTIKKQKYFLSILNSELIFFWLLINSKFNTKKSLRVTTDNVRNIPLKKCYEQFEDKIIINFDKFLVKSEKEYLLKIDDIIYNLYGISNDEKEIIKSYIESYKNSTGYPKSVKRL